MIMSISTEPSCGLPEESGGGALRKITDFLELKRLDNMKLRNFSSGMYVRLAFTATIQTDPDIMLVMRFCPLGG
jgi:lipopolysaccharide transport system ATP-binding protein